MKIIYLGTPQFAIKPLQALMENHEVKAVVTQVDKPQKRGSQTHETAVKTFAKKHSIPVFQFEKINASESVDALEQIDADVLITCAYGKILKERVLNLKKYGVLNIHGSVLPKYRGASPIQSAIIEGEKETGITILKSDIGMDDGDILHIEKIAIEENETAESLFERLSGVGASAILHALDSIEKGTVTYTPQHHERATYTKMFEVEDAKIDFSNLCRRVANFINGLNLSPVAHFTYCGKRFKVFHASSVEEQEFFEKQPNVEKGFSQMRDGEVVLSDRKSGLIVKTKDGFLKVLELQAEGGKRMDISSYLNGKTFLIGSVLNYE